LTAVRGRKIYRGKNPCQDKVEKISEIIFKQGYDSKN